MKSGSESIKNSPVVAQLLAVARKLFDVLNREAFSQLSGRVLELDRRRDRAYLAIRSYVNSMLYSIDDSIVAAAERVERVLDKYESGIEKLPFLEETTLLRKVIADLQSPEMAADVTTLGMGRLIAELVTATTDFNAVFTDRTADEASIKEEQSATTMRRELQERINGFIGFATYSSMVDPAWGELLQLLQPDIERIKSTIDKPEEGDKPASKG